MQTEVSIDNPRDKTLVYLKQEAQEALKRACIRSTGLNCKLAEDLFKVFPIFQPQGHDLNKLCRGFIPNI